MNSHILTMNIRRTLPEARISETVLPLCPSLKLYLIVPDQVQRPFSAEEVASVQAKPPYWSFCWPSGHALARFVIENKRMFEGKSVLDFGAGSGVVAIAASMAGAREVTACDIDQDALDAVRANAALNRADLSTAESLEEVSGKIDLLIASDILYDRQNLPILMDFLGAAGEIIVAESRIKSIDVPPYRKIADLEAHMVPDVDAFDPYRHVKIYRAVRRS